MTPIPLTTSQHFPVSLDRLWRVCSQARYVDRKYRALDGQPARVLTFDVGPGRIEVVLERTVPLRAGRLAAASPLSLPVAVAVRHHTRWSRTGAREALVSIEIATSALPLRAEAAGALREAAPGDTEMRLDWQVRCDAPWAASSIARAFARRIGESMQRDHAFTFGYLREVRSR